MAEGTCWVGRLRFSGPLAEMPVLAGIAELKARGALRSPG